MEKTAYKSDLGVDLLIRNLQKEQKGKRWQVGC